MNSNLLKAIRLSKKRLIASLMLVIKLIREEATSALDSETERHIQESIDALKGQYTIIMIAHRLSTIKNVDQVVVLKGGEIELVGSYEEVLKTSTTFIRMVALQKI